MVKVRCERGIKSAFYTDQLENPTQNPNLVNRQPLSEQAHDNIGICL